MIEEELFTFRANKRHQMPGISANDAILRKKNFNKVLEIMSESPKTLLGLRYNKLISHLKPFSVGNRSKFLSWYNPDFLILISQYLVAWCGHRYVGIST